MKKLLFLGAVAFVTLCLGCKKDNNEKKSDYYKDVPELREEFDNLLQNRDANGQLQGVSYFDALGEGYALTVEFFDVAQGSSNNYLEGFFSIPFENVAPEKRHLPYCYYKFTSEDFANGLARFKAYGAEVQLSYAILRIDTGQTEHHFDFIAVTKDDEVYEYMIKADLDFSAKIFHLKSDFMFKSGEVETSAVFRHKPIKDLNFDIFSVTVKTPAGEYPRYSTTLHFLVNPVEKFSDALTDLPGDYYGVAPFKENLGDHTVFGFHSIDGESTFFTGENEWGETVLEEFVIPFPSEFLTIGPLYGDNKDKFDISGTVDRFLDRNGSTGTYMLRLNSITLNLADITEE